MLMGVFRYFYMFCKLQMFCFRLFKLSYFADVDLSVSNPNLGSNTGFEMTAIDLDIDLLRTLDHNQDLQENTHHVTIVLLLQSLWWKCCGITIGRLKRLLV